MTQPFCFARVLNLPVVGSQDVVGEAGRSQLDKYSSLYQPRQFAMSAWFGIACGCADGAGGQQLAVGG